MLQTTCNELRPLQLGLQNERMQSFQEEKKIIWTVQTNINVFDSVLGKKTICPLLDELGDSGVMVWLAIGDGERINSMFLNRKQNHKDYIETQKSELLSLACDFGSENWIFSQDGESMYPANNSKNGFVSTVATFYPGQRRLRLSIMWKTLGLIFVYEICA